MTTALALRGNISPAKVDQIERHMKGLELKHHKAKASMHEFSTDILHTGEGLLTALGTGIYYGRTNGYKIGPVDVLLGAGVLSLVHGLFSDGDLTGHTLHVGRQVVSSYLTLAGFQKGRAWQAAAGTPPAKTTAGNDISGRQSRTMDPNMMRDVVSRLA
jgi:hypothetical protein